MRKRRIRPSVIITAILFLVVVIAAIKIVAKVVNTSVDTPEGEIQNEDITPLPEKEKEKEPEPQEPENEEKPDIIEEVPAISDNAPQPVYTQEELLDLYPGTVLPLSHDAGEWYIGKMFFVGDSTTHGMKYYGVLENGSETDRVLTPKSGTLSIWNVLTEKVVVDTDGNEMTIPEALKDIEPEICVFTLGVNGVSSCSKEQFVGYYEDLLDEAKKASPDTKIILQSIFPVCSDYQYVKSISMEKINTANSWIAELAKEKDCYYLNTASVLVDETGYLNPDYSNGDGIHLSKLGFEKVLEYIRTHAVK